MCVYIFQNVWYGCLVYIISIKAPVCVRMYIYISWSYTGFLLFWSHLLSLSSILSLVLNPNSNWLIVMKRELVLTCFWFSSHRSADQSTGLGHAFDSLWNFGWWRWQLGHWQIIIDGYIDLVADIDHNEAKYYHQ